MTPRLYHLSPLPSRWLKGLAEEPIRSVQHFGGNRQPQRFGNLEIDDKLDLHVHLYGDLCWARPFEDLVHQACCLPAGFVEVRSVAGETTLLHKERATKHRGECLLGRGLQDEAGDIQRSRG